MRTLTRLECPPEFKPSTVVIDRDDPRLVVQLHYCVSDCFLRLFSACSSFMSVRISAVNDNTRMNQFR